MQHQKPVTFFRDVLLYCDFTETENQEQHCSGYLHDASGKRALIDFVEFGLKARKITSRNFAGDPDGIRSLFMELMTTDNRVEPAGWLKELKIKHFGRQWRLLGKEIQLIDTTEISPVFQEPPSIRIDKLDIDFDDIDVEAMLKGYRTNRALYGEHFAGVIACAFIEMYFSITTEARSTIRFWLKKNRGN